MAGESAPPGSVAVVVIHGNGVAEPGWMNPYLIDKLTDHLRRPSGEALLRPEQASRVSVETEPNERPEGRDTKPPTFKITERDATLGGRTQVTFIEMNWSDLSQVGAAPIAQFFAGLRLLYEAPSVLCRAGLGMQSPNRYYRALHRLILLSVDTVRWVIAGLNGMVIAAALAVGLGNFVADPLADTELGKALMLLDGRLIGPTLAWFLVASLAAGCAMAIRFARRSERENGGLADVAYSTAGFAGLAAVVLAGITAVGWNRLVSPTEYLTLANIVLVLPWLVWSVFITLASLLLGLLAIKRLVFSAPADAPSLARLAGTLALSAQQGAVVKIAVSLIGILILSFRYRRDCDPDTIAKTLCAPFVHQWLPLGIVRLEGVFTINALIVASAIVVATVLFFAPSVMRRRLGIPPLTIARWRPRVILSHVLVVSLIGMTLLDAYVFYGRLAVDWYNEIVMIGRQMVGDYFNDMRLRKLLLPGLLAWINYDQIAKNTVLHLSLIVVLLMLGFLLVSGRIQAFFAGLVHFARDVTDHHYRAITSVPKLVSQVEERLPQTLAGPGIDTPRDQQSEYPRRTRIKRRLDQVMSRLLDGDRTFDRLVFLAHSQGTVIVHDYLRASAADDRLTRVGEIHVLTLASPITHLYQHYFEDYDAAGHGPSWLPGNVASWSNLWRIDDPIAGAVHVPGPPEVANGILGLGGHSDYWREPTVLDIVTKLIAAPLGTRSFVQPEQRFDGTHVSPLALAAAVTTDGLITRG
jgi:hypothetical protein